MDPMARVLTEIRKNPNDGGRGVFAKRDIRKGEIICSYPIDALWAHDKSSGKPMRSRSSFTPEPMYSTLISEEIFNELISQFPDVYKGELVSGAGYKWHRGNADRTLDEWPFYGHIINDGARIPERDVHRIQEGEVLEEEKVEICERYVLDSESRCNSIWGFSNSIEKSNDERFSLEVKASKDIECGEEVFAFYGCDYWLNEPKWRQDLDIMLHSHVPTSISVQGILNEPPITEVKERLLDDERGVFATRDIKMGKIICVYPIDAFQIRGARWRECGSKKYALGIGETGEQLNRLKSVGHESERVKAAMFQLGGPKSDDEIELMSENELIQHAESYMSWEELRRESSNCGKNYTHLSISDLKNAAREIVKMINGFTGDPNRRDWPFHGHMMNDGARIPLHGNAYDLERYKYESKCRYNAILSVEHRRNYTPLFIDGRGRLGLVMLASRDIKLGEEIFYPYGDEYWAGMG